MLPSFHDNLLVSYEVDCAAHRITMRFRHPKSTEDRIVIFADVAGYRFADDAFGNIVSALEPMSVAQLLSEYGAEIAQSYRAAGAPGRWAADLASALQVLTAADVKGFRLVSAFGLSGWILAKEVIVSSTALDPAGRKG